MRMAVRMTFRAALLMAGAWALPACGDDGGGDDAAQAVCEPGDFRACDCEGGSGLRACLQDGSDYGPCDCSDVGSSAGGDGSGAMVGSGSMVDSGAPMSGGDLTMHELQCGNGSCEVEIGETCARCPRDCGECADCGDSDAGACASCGNGVCEPGEDESCEDCEGVESTCDDRCETDSDCAQPWTACIGGGPKCIPTACEDCFGSGEFCCFCDAQACGGVACAPSLEECPPCE
jgi:hypothetical protein